MRSVGKYLLYCLLFVLLSFLFVDNTLADTRYVDPIFAEVTVNKGIVYSVINGKNLDLDVYRPKVDTQTDRPAIIFIHGGGFAVGSKEDMASVCTEFAKKGYVTVSINYRLTDRDYSDKLDPANIKNIVPIMDAQQDSQVAVRWLKANASSLGINKEKILASGNSAGAVLALLLNFNYETVPSGREYQNESVRVVGASSYVGTADPAMISYGDGPVIMFNAGKDSVIIPSWVYPFQNKIVELGIPHEFYWYQDALHGTVPYSDYLSKTTTFFANILGTSVKSSDLNQDNRVDNLDYQIFLNNFGKVSNPLGTIKADINIDGVVDIFDYNQLVAEYGS